LFLNKSVALYCIILKESKKPTKQQGSWDKAQPENFGRNFKENCSAKGEYG
jgi:hypothetical protein